MKSDLQADEVAEYLNQNRAFFHVFPNLVSELSVPHPKQGHEISLLERQVFALREARDGLKVEIDTLKDIAGENGQLLHRVYDFAHGLLAAESEQQAVDWIYLSMQEIFSVDEVSFMSWEIPKTPLQGLNQLGISQNWSQTLKNTLQPDQPRCGLLEDEWRHGLFATTEPMQSVCLLPLGQQQVWGVLALGSSTNRFTPDLGTYFLQEMGRLITARLQRLF